MKQLLLAGLAAACCLPMAANTLYSADTLGEVVSVSRNGKYVAVADNADNTAAHIDIGDSDAVFVGG